jgi:hypothetical protein
MSDPMVRIVTAWSSIADGAIGAVRSAVDAALACVEKSAQFIVTLEPCNVAYRGPGEVHVDMPKHATAVRAPSVELVFVQPGALTVTTFNATAVWGNSAQDYAKVTIDSKNLPPGHQEIPKGLFIGGVNCEPASPGGPYASSRFVLYVDGFSSLP